MFFFGEHSYNLQQILVNNYEQLSKGQRTINNKQYQSKRKQKNREQRIENRKQTNKKREKGKSIEFEKNQKTKPNFSLSNE